MISINALSNPEGKRPGIEDKADSELSSGSDCGQNFFMTILGSYFSDASGGQGSEGEPMPKNAVGTMVPGQSTEELGLTMHDRLNKSGLNILQDQLNQLGLTMLQDQITKLGMTAEQDSTNLAMAMLQDYISESGMIELQESTNSSMGELLNSTSSGMNGLLGSTSEPGISGLLDSTNEPGISGLLDSTNEPGISGLLDSTNESGISRLLNSTSESGMSGLLDSTSGMAILNNHLNEPGTTPAKETALLAEEFQSVFPAGKEANSGLTISSKALPQTGTVLAAGQGEIPPMTGLDEYKGIIAELLPKLSGEIKYTQQLESPSEGANRNLAFSLFKGDMGAQLKYPPTPTGNLVTQGLNFSDGVGQGSSLIGYGTPITEPLLDSNQKTPGLKISTGGLELFGGEGFGLRAVAPEGASSNIESVGLNTTMAGPLRQQAGADAESSLSGQQGFDFSQFEALNLDEAVTTKSDSLEFPELLTELTMDPSQLNKQTSLQQGTSALTSQAAFRQITSALQERMLNQPEVNELEVQLHPEELGKIQISLRWEDGQVHLVCQAAEPATGYLLQNNLADLKQALQSAGVSCGNIDMSFGGQTQDAPHYSWGESNQTDKEEEKSSSEISYLRTDKHEGHRVNLMV